MILPGLTPAGRLLFRVTLDLINIEMKTNGNIIKGDALKVMVITKTPELMLTTEEEALILVQEVEDLVVEELQEPTTGLSPQMMLF